MSKKEILVSCPKCGTKNFTPRGLKAHVCKAKDLPPAGVLERLLDTISPIEDFRGALPLATMEELKVAACQLCTDADNGDEESAIRHSELLQFVKTSSAKKSIAKVAAARALTVVDPQDAEMGRQLAEQYQRAIGGIREVLIFGAMACHVRDTLSARGQGSGNGVKGDGFKAWLELNAPSISRPTAYRFMDLAEGLRDEFHLAKKTDLVHLLTAPLEKLPPPQKKAREKIDAFVEGKSQRQLMFEFGIDTKAGKAKGGDKSKHRSGKRRTKAQVEDDELAENAAEWFEPAFGVFRDAATNPRETWLHLEDLPLANLADVLKRLTKEIDEVCRNRGIKPQALADWSETEDAE